MFSYSIRISFSIHFATNMKKILINNNKILFSFLVLSLVLFLFPAKTQALENSWGLDWILYVSRTDRGADETWKYENRAEYQALLATRAAQEAKNLPETESERKKRIANEYVMKNYSSFFTINSVTKNENWQSLWWNFQYATHKNKLIVHHTATTTKLPITAQEEKDYMKSLYKFHAFSRWRWDIGYNFVIMPSGRIYEWRAGWAGVVWAHATWNNTDSVGISLVWNFQWENNPTQGQLDSLVKLSTSLMKKYTINPNGTTTYFKWSSAYPYVTATSNSTFASHKDAGITACPGENLYAMLPNLRKQISEQLAKSSTFSSITTAKEITTVQSTQNNPAHSRNKTIVPLLPTTDVQLWTAPTQNLIQSDANIDILKSNYLDTHVFTPSASVISRLSWASTIQDIQKIQASLVRVLLYEASEQKEWNITCAPSCAVRYDTKLHITKTLSVTATTGWRFNITLPTKKIKTKMFGLSVYNTPTSSGFITINNYKRVASNGIGLNVFRQGMLFSYGPTKDLEWKTKTQPQLINLVSFQNYMRGIAEASDKEPQTKADLLALLSKSYIMYYIWGPINHPSIPSEAIYNAIDDPRFFQKYLGAGWEKISTTWPKALENTKNQYLVYDNKLPILPYFHCSAGFTWSAKERRWWQDTPYLQSVKDTLGVCDSGDFEGHWVWLSGKWAAIILASGTTIKQVVDRYYPGVTIFQK